jgi:hypothetical protein
MPYDWPLPHPDPVLEEALNIALGYLEATGQAKAGDDTQHLVAGSIIAVWLEGAQHKIRLANVGIVAVQQAHSTMNKRREHRPNVVLPWVGFP